LGERVRERGCATLTLFIVPAPLALSPALSRKREREQNRYALKCEYIIKTVTE
jgi:hypothetical protein